jgi:murein DD-endopeptidase MepM/ murein hydrolase activator NlpD
MLFPSLAGQAFGYLNLNECYRAWAKGEHNGYLPAQSPWGQDPELCARCVAEEHKKRGLVWSYGGWGEDRRDVWNSTYLAREDTFIHFGVDFNAPVGTLVATDRILRITHVGDDAPLTGGWGVYVMGEVADLPLLGDPPVYLLFAHLGRDPDCKVGDVLTPGTRFAQIGAADTNGSWYPHTHVQAILGEKGVSAPDPLEFDGYGHRGTKYADMCRHLDPLRYVKLW